jgi:hypothetical protein
MCVYDICNLSNRPSINLILKNLGHVVYTDVDQVKNSKEKKIVLVPWWLYRMDNHQEYTSYDLSWADLIVCNVPEIMHEEWNTYYSTTANYFNNSNIIFILGGVGQFPVPDSDRVFFPFLNFFHNVESNNIPMVYNAGPRPYTFDALLGSKKSFRRYIFNRLKEDHLLDRSLVSLTAGPYDQHYQNITVYNQPCADYESPALAYLEEDSVRQFKAQARSVETRYSANMLPDKNIPMSWLIPEKIYRNSWYSIVSETDVAGFKFMTEKTAKPLFAKRIFVMFSSCGHLEFLRSQGFQTFSNIIDESYDTESDHNKRFDMAWQQVRKLAQSDPVQLYTQVQEILEHNFLKIAECQQTNCKDAANFIQLTLSK